MRRQLLAVLLTAALILVACGGDEADEGEAADTGRESVTIGAVLKTFANPYWTAMRDGIQDRADELGVSVTIEAATSEEDTEEQLSKLEALSGQAFDCFEVAPITGTNLIQPLVGVAQENIPIVNVDNPIDFEAAESAGVTVETFIASNNEQAGNLAGEHMAELLGDGGTVALLGGISGNETSNARLDGFRSAASEGGLEVIQEVAADWDREKALTAAETIIRANRDIGGFFAANDTMALGVAQAIENARTGEIQVIGVDGIEDALNAVKGGSLSATVSQYPYAIGGMGVEACVAAVTGETLPETADAPIQLIEPDNVDQAIESFPAPFFEFESPFAPLIQE